MGYWSRLTLLQRFTIASAAIAAALAITANRRQNAFAAKVEVGTAGKAIPTYLDYNL